jgi:hypothetical protein
MVLFVVTLSVAHAAMADDLDLVTTSVPPNVVILFDNSGSMNHHLWDGDFDPNKVYPGWCWFGQAPTVAGSSCPGLGNPGDECPNNETALGVSGTFNYTCGGVTRMLYHDASTPQMTRYSVNYMNWLYGIATPADLVDEPTETRLQAAKKMTSQVVDAVNPDDVQQQDFGPDRDHEHHGRHLDPTLGVPRRHCTVLRRNGRFRNLPELRSEYDGRELHGRTAAEPDRRPLSQEFRHDRDRRRTHPGSERPSRGGLHGDRRELGSGRERVQRRVSRGVYGCTDQRAR